MLGGLKTAIDVALQGQASRLAGLAEAYKNRALDQVKASVISAGVTAALAMVGLALMLIAVAIGFAALYYWVALWHGTMAGLGAAGGAALVLSLLMFVVVAVRAKGSTRKQPQQLSPSAIRSEAAEALRKTQASVKAIGVTAERNAAALGREAVDAASGVMRTGSREAVLATLVATVVIGILVGRRR